MATAFKLAIQDSRTGKHVCILLRRRIVALPAIRQRRGCAPHSWVGMQRRGLGFASFCAREPILHDRTRSTGVRIQYAARGHLFNCGICVSALGTAGHLEVLSANIVGFSMGGAVALGMALQRPTRVSRLALTNSLATYQGHWRKWAKTEPTCLHPQCGTWAAE